MLRGEHDIQTLHDGIYQPREADGGALGEQSLSPIGRSSVAVFVYLNNCDSCTAMDCGYLSCYPEYLRISSTREKN